MRVKSTLLLRAALLISFLLIVPFGCSKVTLEKNEAPTCTITSPTNDDTIEQGDLVTIYVDASDIDGNVTAVLFTIGSTNVATVNSSPYSYTWNTQGEAIGSHTIKVTVTDNDGLSTSDEITISLSNTVTDIDGNTYEIIKIGSQLWMAENLATTHFSDGTNIPLVTSGASWTNLTTPGYCWYNNNESGYGSTYGALYNWYTVNTGKLCPDGWHVPSDTDWKGLTNYLGGLEVAGGKLKETGTVHWAYPNEGATNESGFTAVGAGLRYDEGNYEGIGELVSYWVTNESDENNAWTRSMSQRSRNLTFGNKYKQSGLSVRCIKD